MAKSKSTCSDKITKEPLSCFQDNDIPKYALVSFTQLPRKSRERIINELGDDVVARMKDLIIWDTEKNECYISIKGQ